MIKSKLISIGLIMMTVFLIGAIFYFRYFLMENPGGASISSQVAPKKTKAQVGGSEKFIALNQSTDIYPAKEESIIISPSPTTKPTVNMFLTENITLTPTEIILANFYNSPASSITETEQPLTSPTEIESLLSSGYLNYSLVIFGIATFLIFYSLIF